MKQIIYFFTENCGCIGMSSLQSLDFNFNFPSSTPTADGVRHPWLFPLAILPPSRNTGFSTFATSWSIYIWSTRDIKVLVFNHDSGNYKSDSSYWKLSLSENYYSNFDPRSELKIRYSLIIIIGVWDPIMIAETGRILKFYSILFSAVLFGT